MARHLPKILTYCFLVILLAIGVCIIVVICAYRSSAIATLLSKKPSLVLVTETVVEGNIPDCTIVRVTFAPEQGIKELSLLVRLPHSISSSVVMTKHFELVRPQIPSKHVYEAYEAHVSITPDCKVTSNEISPKGQLTVELNKNERDLLVFGRDITLRQDDVFIGAAHESVGPKQVIFDYQGSVTYEAYGHLLPGTITIVDASSGAKKITQGD